MREEGRKRERKINEFREWKDLKRQRLEARKREKKRDGESDIRANKKREGEWYRQRDKRLERESRTLKRERNKEINRCR